jgi:hypothetical protein
MLNKKKLEKKTQLVRFIITKFVNSDTLITLLSTYNLIIKVIIELVYIK